jgi:hypothetical protein
MRPPIPVILRKFPPSFFLIALAAAFTAGCGEIAPHSPDTTSSGNTSVTVLSSATANDQLSEFNIDFTSLTLTSQSGKTVTLLSSPLYPEFVHLNGTGEPLITVTVPQDIYTSASATLGSAQFTCVSYDSSENETWTSTFSDMGVPAANVTVSLAAPITVSGKGMGLSLDLLVTQSASWGTCDSSGVNGPYSITPSFNLTPVAIAAQPTNSANGKANGLVGLISSVDVGGTGFSVIGEDGPNLFGPGWRLSTSSSTVFQGIGGYSQLTAGMPVDMDAAIQPDGSLLATRISVEDTNTASLSIFEGPVEGVYAPTQEFSIVGREQQGYLDANAYYDDSMPFSFGTAVFQTSAQLTNIQSLPFSASFNAVNMVAGQDVYLTSHALSAASGHLPIPATTITLIPQTINGTISAIGSEGGFTTYAVTLAPYDLFPALALQPDQSAELTNPNTVVVYADSSAQMLNTTPIAVGSVERFYGLVFNDNGTLRMDCAQIDNGVAE